MNRRSLSFVLLCEAMILQIACTPPEPHEVQVLKWVDSADPIADAKRALKKGDHTLLAVCGLGVLIPGTDQNKYDHLKKTYGIKAIEGTSDCLVSEEHFRLNTKAAQYAEAYNRYIVKEFTPKDTQ